MGKPRSSNSGEDLHSAARTGDLHAVRSVCSSNPLAINSRDKHSRTPLDPSLHLAAWAGQTEVASYLCKHKADVGATAMDNMSAIHFAAQKGHLDVVRTLLASGASITASNRKGLTALHYAVQGSHLDLIKYLVKKGSSLSAKTKAEKTPLDLANSEEVRLLLVECEKSAKECEHQTGKREGEGSDSKPSLEDKVVVSDSEAVAKHGEKEYHEDKEVKRKAEEAEAKGSLLESKKARISLNHLLVTDDTQEEENL